MTATRPILIVEDSDEDFQVMMWAWRKAGIIAPVIRCLDGEQALDRMYRRGEFADLQQDPGPAMVILDLNLPRTDGRSVLAEIKRNPALRCTPVIIFTTSSNPKDVERCYQSGANSYIIKPANLARVRTILQSMVAYWMDVVHLTEPEVASG